MPSARGEAFNTRPKGLASDCCRCISGQRSARPELLGAVAPDHRCFPRARCVCALLPRPHGPGRLRCGAEAVAAGEAGSVLALARVEEFRGAHFTRRAQAPCETSASSGGARGSWLGSQSGCLQGLEVLDTEGFFV